jgi:predicted small integral membrane protein
MSKANEATKLRWNSFTLAYLGLGFTFLMIAAGFWGMSKSPAWEYGAMPKIVFFAVGIALLVVGFIADEVSHRRGDYKMPDLNQVKTSR